MQQLISRARAEYEYIVIDTPPLLAVSDALLISSSVDTTLLVVRWEHTPRAVVRSALKLIRENGIPLAGVVLSRVNLRKHARYSYGDAYVHTRHANYYG